MKYTRSYIGSLVFPLFFQTMGFLFVLEDVTKASPPTTSSSLNQLLKEGVEVVDKESAWTGKILYLIESGTDAFIEWTKDARNQDITDGDLKSYMPLERLVATSDPHGVERCLDEEKKLCVGLTFFDTEDNWLGKIVDVNTTRQSASANWVEDEDGEILKGGRLDQIFFEQMAAAAYGHCIDIEGSKYCVGQFFIKNSQSADGRTIGEIMGVHKEDKKLIVHQIESEDLDFSDKRAFISPKDLKILDSECAGGSSKEQYCRGEKVTDMRDLWEGEIVAINGKEGEEKEAVVEWKKITQNGFSLSMKGETDNKDIVPIKYLMISREEEKPL